MSHLAGRARLVCLAAVILAATAVAALWASRDAPPGNAAAARGIRLGATREVSLGDHPVRRHKLWAVALEGSTLFAAATLEDGHAIVAIDMNTGRVQQLTPARSPELELVRFAHGLRASPTHVAWVEYVAGKEELRLLDRRSLREVVVDENPTQLGSPAIAGDRLVWQNWRDGTTMLFGYDLNSGRQFRIAEGMHLAWLDLCSRDWLIYVTRIPHGRWGSYAALRARHLTTGDDIAVGALWYPQTAGSGRQQACDGNNVAWISFRYRGASGVLEYRLFDLTSRRTRILELPISPGPPSVELSQDIALNSWIAYLISQDTYFALDSPRPMIGGGHRLFSGDTVAWIIEDQPGPTWRLYTATIERDR